MDDAKKEIGRLHECAAEAERRLHAVTTQLNQEVANRQREVAEYEAAVDAAQADPYSPGAEARVRKEREDLRCREDGTQLAAAQALQELRQQEAQQRQSVAAAAQKELADVQDQADQATQQLEELQQVVRKLEEAQSASKDELEQARRDQAAMRRVASLEEQAAAAASVAMAVAAEEVRQYQERLLAAESPRQHCSPKGRATVDELMLELNEAHTQLTLAQHREEELLITTSASAAALDAERLAANKALEAFNTEVRW